MDLLLMKSKSSDKDVLLLNGWVSLINHKHCAGGISTFCNSLHLIGISMCQGHSLLLQITGSMGKNSVNCKKKGHNLAQRYRSFL